MTLRTVKTTVTGLLGLQQYENDFQPSGIGSASLLRDEKATVASIQSIVDRLTGPTGAIANFTYTVATLAERPAVNTVPDGTLVFVESQKSWYWTDLGNNTYRRVIEPNEAWMAQAAWGIDTVNGNDENDGSVASPLRSFTELAARLPTISQSLSITIAAGSTFASIVWNPSVVPGQASIPIVTLTAVRVLSGAQAVLTSTDEAGNAAPTLDTGAALPIMSILQSSTGSTSTVVALIAGTNFRVSKWRSSAGFATTPPVAGVDTVSVVTNVAVAYFAFTSSDIAAFVSNLSIGGVELTNTSLLAINTCVVGGNLGTGRPCILSFGGCAMNLNSFITSSSGAARLSFTLCGLLRTGQFAVQAITGGFVSFVQCVLQNGGVDVLENGQIVANHLGIFAAPGAAIDVHADGLLHITNTLYGTGSAAQGVRVREGGRATVLTVTPTLAAAGQELELEGAPTAIPALAGGAAVPAASALTNWAQWVAGPFSRNVVSYSSGASVINQT